MNSVLVYANQAISVNCECVCVCVCVCERERERWRGRGKNERIAKFVTREKKTKVRLYEIRDFLLSIHFIDSIFQNLVNKSKGK